jgi:ATP-dependent Clp protease protease subunit
MIHQPMGGIKDKLLISKLKLKKSKVEKRNFSKLFHSIQVNLLISVWKDSDRDYWMIAQEAKDYGMIDEVLKQIN